MANRVTEVDLGVLTGGTPSARVSEASLGVLAEGDPKAHVCHVLIAILCDVPPYPTPGRVFGSIRIGGL